MDRKEAIARLGAGEQLVAPNGLVYRVVLAGGDPLAPWCYHHEEVDKYCGHYATAREAAAAAEEAGLRVVSGARPQENWSPVLACVEAELRHHQFRRIRVENLAGSTLSWWQGANVLLIVQDYGDHGLDVYGPLSRTNNMDDLLSAIAEAGR